MMTEEKLQNMVSVISIVLPELCTRACALFKFSGLGPLSNQGGAYYFEINK